MMKKLVTIVITITTTTIITFFQHTNDDDDDDGDDDDDDMDHKYDHSNKGNTYVKKKKKRQVYAFLRSYWEPPKGPAWSMFFFNEDFQPMMSWVHAGRALSLQLHAQQECPFARRAPLGYISINTRQDDKTERQDKRITPTQTTCRCDGTT